MKNYFGRSAIITEFDLLQYRAENAEKERIHFPYELEERFLTAVSTGNRELAFQLMDEGFHSFTGVLSKSEQKQMEYTAAILVSIVLRAAIKGGVDSYLAYDLGDLYLQKLSQPEISLHPQNFLYDVVETFTEEVRKVQSVNIRSIHTLHTKQYVNNHLNQALTLEEIAAHVGVSPTYLSSTFKSSEGIGLKQYIIQQRMKTAKNLLMYSTTEIGRIAAAVGFTTQSHFGHVFKRHTGMTPLEYRKRMQK